MTIIWWFKDWLESFCNLLQAQSKRGAIAWLPCVNIKKPMILMDPNIYSTWAWTSLNHGHLKHFCSRILEINPKRTKWGTVSSREGLERFDLVMALPTGLVPCLTWFYNRKVVDVVGTTWSFGGWNLLKPRSSKIESFLQQQKEITAVASGDKLGF